MIGMQRVIIVLVLVNFLFSQVDMDSKNQSNDSTMLTLFISIKEPFLANSKELSLLLKKDNIDFTIETDNEISIYLTEELLIKHFKVVLKYTISAGSSSDSEIKYLVIKSYEIPSRYKKLIESIYFDHQRS